MRPRDELENNSCGEPQDGGRRTWGGFSGPRNFPRCGEERRLDCIHGSCGEPQDGDRRTWGGFSGPRNFPRCGEERRLDCIHGSCGEPQDGEPEEPGGDSPVPAISLALARNGGSTAQTSSVLAESRKTGAGGPGGDSPAPQFPSLWRGWSGSASMRFESSCGENRRTGAGGPGGDSPAPATPLARAREVALKGRASCRPWPSRSRARHRTSLKNLRTRRKTGAGGPGGDSPAPVGVFEQPDLEQRTSYESSG